MIEGWSIVSDVAVAGNRTNVLVVVDDYTVVQVILDEVLSLGRK